MFTTNAKLLPFTYKLQTADGKSGILAVRGTTISVMLKAMLHEAIFPATCLVILLRHKLHEKLLSVTLRCELQEK